MITTITDNVMPVSYCIVSVCVQMYRKLVCEREREMGRDCQRVKMLISVPGLLVAIKWTDYNKSEGCD